MLAKTKWEGRGPVMSVFKGMVLGPVVHLPYIQKQTGRHEVNESMLQRVSGSDVRPSRGGKSSSKGRPYMDKPGGKGLYAEQPPPKRG